MSVQTRAHVLTEATLLARHFEDPAAYYISKEHRVYIANQQGMLPRQARQLAYLLCEAADALEHSTEVTVTVSMHK